jgi:hypothetical protein
MKRVMYIKNTDKEYGVKGHKMAGVADRPKGEIRPNDTRNQFLATKEE